MLNESLFARLVRRELERAREKHPPQHNLHEGVAILFEELCEFWDEVRKQTGERKDEAVLKELVQVSAMAQRCAEDCGLVAGGGS